MKGQQKVSIPDFNLNFDPNRTIATCYRVWTLLTRDHTILQVIGQGVRLDFISNPPPPPPAHKTGPLFSNHVSQPPKRLLLIQKLSLCLA